MTQTSTDVSIVPARPEHAPFIAWVMLTAARSHLQKGFWDFLGGPDDSQTLRFLEAMTTTPATHWTHHSLYLVAEVDGRPASALSGYFEEEHPTAAPESVVEAAQASGMDVAEMLSRWQTSGGDSVRFCAPEHAPGVWIVEHVATLPEYRRRGLVDRLMEPMLERGRSRGATSADLGVLIGNDGAQRAYEKAGFRVISEKLHPDFERVYACPGIRLLSRPL